MLKRILLWTMAGLYLLAGIYHFIDPGFYETLLPDYIPYHKACIAISGIAEMLLAVLLLFSLTRKLAAWFIVIMLSLFLIIHVQMIIDHATSGGVLFWIAVVRLPLQFLLIYWAYLYAKDPHLPAGK